MEDLARLQIRVQSLEADLADRRLGNLARSGARAERATDGLGRSFMKFAGPAAVMAGAVSSLMKVTSVTREFDVLNAQLITATGSADNAALAFNAIQTFASETPYDLQQVTEGFTKLVNLGLTPSERALTSYGDTASAMGKDLNQLIEAVADAATGEFERLKEFGIKTKSEGDNVSFTFRGVTTTVKKNAEEIEEYLMQLGEVNFAGAMAERMDTLDGAMSNLGDEWDKLWLNISQQGVGDLITDGVRGAIDILAELNAWLASGQLTAYIEAIAGKFTFFSDTATGAFDAIFGVIRSYYSWWSEITGITVDDIITTFTDLPENVKAVIQLMGVEIASLVDYGREYGGAMVDAILLKFDQLLAEAEVYGKEIGDKMNPFDGSTYDFSGEMARVQQQYTENSEEIWRIASENAERIAQSRRESISGVLEEREEALKSFDDQIAAADELRAAYEAKNEAAKGQGDVLGQFAAGAIGTGGGEDDSGPSKAEEKQAERDRKALERLQQQKEREFEAVRLSLRSEEEAIQESYDRRLEIILANTEEGSKQQAELKQRLEEEFATDALGDLGAVDTYQEQLDQLQEYYERRRELIMENTALTEEQRTELEAQLTEQRNERLKALEQERMSMVLSSTSDMFNSLSSVAKNFAGEQSSIYKVMFAASKGFAIADAVVKIQQGIAQAAAIPFPANLGAMATVAASTAGIVSTIASTTMDVSGAYDKGGNIPHGKVGLVGEFGPELVNGPANVVSREKTMELIKQGGNESGNIQNNDYTLNFNIKTEDADSFRRSRGQVEADMAAAMGRVQRRA